MGRNTSDTVPPRFSSYFSILGFSCSPFQTNGSYSSYYLHPPLSDNSEGYAKVVELYNNIEMHNNNKVLTFPVEGESSKKI